MAKKTVALFEVINRDKPAPPPVHRPNSGLAKRLERWYEKRRAAGRESSVDRAARRAAAQLRAEEIASAQTELAAQKRAEREAERADRAAQKARRDEEAARLDADRAAERADRDAERSAQREAKRLEREARQAELAAQKADADAKTVEREARAAELRQALLAKQAEAQALAAQTAQTAQVPEVVQADEPDYVMPDEYRNRRVAAGSVLDSAPASSGEITRDDEFGALNGTSDSLADPTIDPVIDSPHPAVAHEAAVNGSAPRRAAPWLPGRRAVDWAVDAERGEVRLKTTYAAAAVLAFAVLAAVAVAFIAGRQLAPAAASDAAAAGRQGSDGGEGGNGVAVLTGAARPGVADLGNGPATPYHPPAAGAPTEQVPTDPDPADQPAPKAVNPDVPPVKVDGRTPGAQYVVIQSYADESDARATQQVLAANGIDCTVEPRLKTWSEWYSVLGSRGFSSIRDNPAYDRYVARIHAIGEEYHRQKRAKSFDPSPYGWREQ